MRKLTLEQFDAESDAFDRSVLAAGELDLFCSSSDWVIPAARGLMPGREPWIRSFDGGYLAFMAEREGRGLRYLEPLEAMWGLGCPLTGSDAEAAVAALIEMLEEPETDWHFLVLTGIYPESPLRAALIEGLGPRYPRRQHDPTLRHVASLEGGIDAFLERRTVKFRKGIRHSANLARREGLEIESVHCTTAEQGARLFDRALTLEGRSHKGLAGSGILSSSMTAFYAEMLARLARRGHLRAAFARHRERDVGFVLGAVFGGTYRGLQFSYDLDFSRFSVGNLLQVHQIEALCAEGIEHYDLGTGLEYKPRWAEREVVSETWLLARVPLARH